MTLDVDRVADALLEGVKALIAKEIAPLREENEALRARLDALQGRKDGLAIRGWRERRR